MYKTVNSEYIAKFPMGVDVRIDSPGNDVKSAITRGLTQTLIDLASTAQRDYTD